VLIFPSYFYSTPPIYFPDFGLDLKTKEITTNKTISLVYHWKAGQGTG
jgi:hypothetical protein